MWITWTCISLAQLCTNRYLKHYWRWRQTVHSILGVLSLITTFIGLMFALSYYDFDFRWEPYSHFKAGWIFYVLCTGLCLSGMVALAVRRYVEMEWKTRKVLDFIKFHKYFAYTVQMLVQITISLGIHLKFPKVSKMRSLLVFNLILFFGTLTVLEVIH
jgi:hypothetical protein